MIKEDWVIIAEMKTVIYNSEENIANTKTVKQVQIELSRRNVSETDPRKYSAVSRSFTTDTHSDYLCA